MKEITLKTPIKFEGKDVTTLSLDLDALTGNDLDTIESIRRKELQVDGEALVSPETDGRYIAMVAAHAAGVPVELIGCLKAADHIHVKAEVRNFLFSAVD